MAEKSDSIITEDSQRRAALLASGRDFIWTQRCTLPAKTTSADFSVWSFVKQCIGKDLTKISMPVALNEPISFLQRIAEYMEYSELLDEAAKQTDPVRRLEYVCAFAVSATSSNWNRIGKPFNPLLGETYELHHGNFVFVAEQVSHHPPITAFHVEASNYRLWATVQFKLRFWGKSIEVLPKGVVTLELLNPHEWYTWQNPNLTVHNVLLGKIWIEHVGTMPVTNHTLGFSAEIEFQPSSWFTHVANQVVGKIYKSQSSNSSSIFGANLFSTANETPPMRILYGNWTRGLFSVEPHCWDERMNSTHSVTVSSPEKQTSENRESQSIDPNPSDSDSGPQYGFEIPLVGQRCLWIARPRPVDSGDFYNFTRFTMGLNELTPELHEARFAHGPCANRGSDNHDLPPSGPMLSAEATRCPFLPPTDCRFRPDIRALELGNLDVAALEKNRLEEKQRHMRKLMTTEPGGPRSTQSSGSLARKKPSPSAASVGTTSPSHSSGTDTLLPRSQPIRSRSSAGPLLLVGPVWFQLRQNQLTKQEEWQFTGDYWSRDWSRCPDLY